MKKTILILLALLASAIGVSAQSGGLVNATRGYPQANDGTTGTTLHGTAIVNPSGNAINAGTSNTAVRTFIVIGGAGTTGNANLAAQGSVAPCTMDSTIASGAAEYYVINSTTTAKECHAQASAPSSGTFVIGWLHDQATTLGSTALVSVSSFFVAGSASGCTLPGVNLAVLSEHPVGTCYGSLDFTWDDTASAQRLMIGDGTNVFTGSAQVAVIGFATNDLTNCRRCFVIGNSNVLAGASPAGTELDKFVLGSSVNIQNVTNATFTNAVALGVGHNLFNTLDTVVMGRVNNLGKFNAAGSEQFGFVGGWNNGVNDHNGTAALTHFGVLCDQCNLNNASDGSVSAVWMVGFGNDVESDLGAVGGSYILGLDNNVDAIVGDVSILGASNFVHTGVASGSGGFANDSVIAGAQNTTTSVGLSGAYGIGMTLSSCTGCAAFGYQAHLSATDTATFGVSPNPELVIQGPITQAGTKPMTELSFALANASSPGTSVNHIVKLSGAPSLALIAATTDTDGFVGIVTAGAGTTGNATITFAGTPFCVFDGATTAGDYVQNSSGTAGDCHDAGSSFPASGQVVGRVLSTNAAGGTYQMFLFSPSR